MSADAFIVAVTFAQIIICALKTAAFIEITSAAASQRAADKSKIRTGFVVQIITVTRIGTIDRPIAAFGLIRRRNHAQLVDLIAFGFVIQTICALLIRSAFRRICRHIIAVFVRIIAASTKHSRRQNGT